ncbi:hypothetical protein J9332_00990 [Aquimarina celericrescens]|nr:hypothetical protein [Aquimarina celericrescens]
MQSVTVIAQNDKDTEDAKSYVLADVSYISDAVFMGRRDSISVPYLLPTLGYFDKSGFYANASLSYLTRSNESRVDLSLITVGYNFTRKKFTTGVAGTAYFFNEDSYNVQSEILGGITATLGYDFKILETSLTASSYFNDNSDADFFIGLQLERTFYALKKNLLIIPSLTVHAGSQYFYEEYYRNNRLGNGNRQGQGREGMGAGGINSSTVNIQEADQFDILSYELSIPFHFYYKSFIFSFTPEFAFPQSTATIITEEEIFQEDLDNAFYWSLGISYWFYTKK